MITLLKSQKQTSISYSEVVLTPTQAELFEKNEELFFKVYGESLKWEELNGKEEKQEWHNLYVKGKTPY